MIKSKNVSYQLPAEAHCQCRKPIVWYRTQCTDCIRKEVKEKITSHNNKMRNPLFLTNYEVVVFKEYS